MDSTLPSPANWIVRETAFGREIRCARQAGQGRFAAWLMIFALVGICGYGAAVFLLGWLSGEEILIGGVVMFSLLLGGLTAGLYLISAMFRTTTYLLGPQSLSMTTWQPIIGQSTQEIPRSMIRWVVRLCTPPQSGRHCDTWRTLLAVSDSGGQEPLRELPGTVRILRRPRGKRRLSLSPRQFSERLEDAGGHELTMIDLEGETEEESIWLAPLIAQWAAAEVRVQNSAERP